jgi:hypothetical protein
LFPLFCFERDREPQGNLARLAHFLIEPRKTVRFQFSFYSRYGSKVLVGLIHKAGLTIFAISQCHECCQDGLVLKTP